MFDSVQVTGVTRNGKRFKNIYSSTVDGWSVAMHINLWRGSVFGVKEGKRTLIKRVWN